MHERNDVGTGVGSSISSNTIISDKGDDQKNNKMNSLVGSMSIDRWVCKVDSPSGTNTDNNSYSDDEIRYFLFSHQSGFNVLNKAFKGTRTQAIQLLQKGIKGN